MHLRQREAFVSTLFDDLAGISAKGAALLADASVHRLGAGAEEPAETMDNASFLIVEEGFVVIRSTGVDKRGVVLCLAGAGALLPAPLPGETLHALVDARVTLVSEATQP